jgi:hypothetical protein
MRHIRGPGVSRTADAVSSGRRDATASHGVTCGSLGSLVGAQGANICSMTSQGSPHARFQRALETRNLLIIEAAAVELPKIGLDDALVILSLLAEGGDPRFDRAAARWLGRLLLETPAGLSDARFALALVERLPTCRNALHGLARRR